MLFYPAALPLSQQTLTYVTGIIRRHRKQIGSPFGRRERLPNDLQRLRVRVGDLVGHWRKLIYASRPLKLGRRRRPTPAFAAR